MLNKLHNATVRKQIRDNGKWRGYMAPSKVSHYHITGGWNIGCRVKFTSEADMKRQVDSFRYFNCNGELGKGVAFYELEEVEQIE